MTSPRSRPLLKGRRSFSLLVPVGLLIAGMAYLGAARGENSVPAQVMPYRSASVATGGENRTPARSVPSRPTAKPQPIAQEQPPLVMHSLIHPFAPAPTSQEPFFMAYNRFYGGAIQPGYPIASGEKAVWYSMGANTIRASLLLPDVTWLGTEAGLKRLDNRKRTVQHFGTLDGLPYNSVTALAGSAQQLYCCAGQIVADGKSQSIYEAGPHRSTFALCRYHAESGRWEAIAEATRDYPQGVQVGAPEQSKAQSKYRTSALDRAEYQYVAVDGGHASLVIGPALPGKGLVLTAPTQGGEAEEIFCPSFARAPFRVSFAYADADNLWIGSDLGLLRYDFKARRWERLLSDLVVTGGCPAAEGGLWLLTQRFDPAHSDKDGHAIQTKHCQITRFIPGKAPQHFALADHENHANQSGGELTFTNIVVAGDRVWTTEQREVMSIHAQFIYFPTVYSLRPATGRVTQEATSQSSLAKNDVSAYDAVPEVVLAHAMTGGGGLVPYYMQQRFPGWACPHDEKDIVWRTVPNPGAPIGVEPPGDRWYTQSESGNGPGGSFSRNVLKHVGTAPVLDESYIFPKFTAPTRDQVSAPALLGGNIYLIVQTYPARLCRWDRKAAAIVPIPEMDAPLAQNRPDSDPYRLMSDGAALWVGNGHVVLRYDVQTRRIDTWEGDRTQGGSWASPYSLLSVGGGKAWVKGAPNRLLTADINVMGQLTPVTLPAFPAEVEQDTAEASLFALEDGIAWFQTKSAAVPRHPVLIGYRTQTRSWTSAYPASIRMSSPAGTLPIVRQGATHWFYSSAGPLGFDTETGKWAALPAIPKAMQAYSPFLTAIDARNAWVLSDSHLLRLDRLQNTWSITEMPFVTWPFDSAPAVREGGSLLVPTRAGLWALNLATGQLTQGPATSTSGNLTNFNVAAIDPNAVWINAGRSGDGFLIRFDRKTHTFTSLPGKPEGLMPQYYGMQWVGDGESCWLNTPGAAYRLDLKTQRWENISARLAAGREQPTFQQVVPDGDDVWLVAALTDAHYAPLSHPPAVPLYRYHCKTGEITPVQPAAGAPIRPHLLTVNHASVLLATVEGDFRLDRTTRRWQPVQPPPLPGGVPFQERLAVYEEAGNYWFVGTDSSLRTRR